MRIVDCWLHDASRTEIKMDGPDSYRVNVCLNNELARLTTLRNLNLLDTPPTEAFDRITRLAAKLFDLPISAVSLTDSDRQWFKSRVGVEHRQIPRLQAPCSEVADASKPLVVTDLLENDSYRHSYLATSGVRFYAGAPLVTKEGFCLGAMCVLGMQPRQITAGEVAALQDMASMVMEQIELRRALGRVEPISGLPNRLQFKEDYEDLVEERRGELAHLVMITIARPDEVSAAVRVMGSLYIEEMAREAILLLTTAVEGIGTIFHVAETQFVFFAPRGIELAAYSQKLSQTLRTHRTLEVSRFVTTKAVGIVPFIMGTIGNSDLIRMAHSATQDAHDSQTQVSLFSETQDRSFHRRFLVMNRFGAALENLQTLHLVYQPRVETRTERCVGVEALLRWTDPLLGIVSPSEFMPIIELSFMARAITEWVLTQAISQLGCWQKDGLDLQMSVNISASNLAEPDFVPRLLALVYRYGVSPERLELEITESAFMTNTDEALSMLEQITDSGIRLAIDDFGTGYSSLSYLERLPANVIKIDQSFIKDMLANPRKRSLVTTMIKLTHDLGYRVVAEGVETREVADFLQQANCDEAQGYLFARPMPIDQLRDWLGEGCHNHDSITNRVRSSPSYSGP